MKAFYEDDDIIDILSAISMIQSDVTKKFLEFDKEKFPIKDIRVKMTDREPLVMIQRGPFETTPDGNAYGGVVIAFPIAIEELRWIGRSFSSRSPFDIIGWALLHGKLVSSQSSPITGEELEDLFIAHFEVKK